MAPSDTTPAPIRLGPVQWLICAMAAIGFLFDIYSVLVGPLILRPALAELGQLQLGTPRYTEWAGYLFWIPPLAGGFFGLIGGYLTDRFGRRRVLVYAILLYTFSAVAAGFAASLETLLLWRSLSFIGVCVEFVAAVAWLAELFPNPKQREAVLGYTQAFSSLGGVLVSAANYLASHYSASLPLIYGGHSSWRYTLISAVLPAIPLVIIRPFLPESPEWKKRKEAGTLRRPSFAELFAPQYRKTTIVTALLFACGYGAAFGAIQQAPQITPALTTPTQAEIQKLPPPKRAAAQSEVQKTVSSVQGTQELGGLAGRIALAVLALIIVSRRALLRVFLVPGVFIVPYVFFYPATHDLDMFRIGMFFAGFCTVAQLSFWGNYLPRVYPVHLRGTGEGFAANVGGRMLGTSAAYVTTHLAVAMPGAAAATRLAYAAAAVALAIYALGLTLSFFLPEPPETLAD
jgi:MFS family permease